MTDIEDIIQNLPDDSYIQNYDDDDEGFIDDIRGCLSLKEKTPPHSFSSICNI